jgi:hypothetical protein
MSNEGVRIVKEEVLSYFKVIQGGTHQGKAEKNHDKP